MKNNGNTVTVSGIVPRLDELKIMVNDVSNRLVLMCQERNIPLFSNGENIAIAPVSDDNSHDRETPNKRSRKSTKIEYPNEVLQNPWLKVNDSRYKQCGGNPTLFQQAKSIKENIEKR